jgi:hypothetical protein
MIKGACKIFRGKIKQHSNSVFGGFSPKWAGTRSEKTKEIERLSLNITMIG